MRLDEFPLTLCGGRGTYRPPDSGVRAAPAFAVGPPAGTAFPRTTEVSEPRIAVFSLLRGMIERDAAGAVIRLNVERENAPADGLAAVSPGRFPNIACRVGFASTRPSAEASFNWFGETRTEFPRTDRPSSRPSRDMAVIAPGLLAKRGMPTPFLP